MQQMQIYKGRWWCESVTMCEVSEGCEGDESVWTNIYLSRRAHHTSSLSLWNNNVSFYIIYNRILTTLISMSLWNNVSLFQHSNNILPAYLPAFLIILIQNSKKFIHPSLSFEHETILVLSEISLRLATSYILPSSHPHCLSEIMSLYIY